VQLNEQEEPDVFFVQASIGLCVLPSDAETLKIVLGDRDRRPESDDSWKWN
jgi:hypothetical protein